jgi:hypothetical protein
MDLLLKLLTGLGGWFRSKQQRGKNGVPGRNNAAVEDKGNKTPVKVNEGAGKINDEPIIAGSRFVSLSDDIPDINEADLEIEDGSKEKEQIEQETMEALDFHAVKVQSALGKIGSQGTVNKKSDGKHDRITKESKLATHGGGQFKGKHGAIVKKGIES